MLNACCTVSSDFLMACGVLLSGCSLPYFVVSVLSMHSCMMCTSVTMSRLKMSSVSPSPFVLRKFLRNRLISSSHCLFTRVFHMYNMRAFFAPKCLARVLLLAWMSLVLPICMRCCAKQCLLFCCPPPRPPCPPHHPCPPRRMRLLRCRCSLCWVRTLLRRGICRRPIITCFA